MTIVAWDAETCSQPLNSLTETQKTRFDKEVQYKLAHAHHMEKEEISNLVRSIHPFLGWICCISAVSGTLERGPNAPVSWTASSPEDEVGLLKSFWRAVAGFPKDTVWATFNGKRFDVPFVEARSARYGLHPTRRDILNVYPYRHRPHADLARLWPQHYALEDLCGLLGLNSPKDGFDGSQVAGAIRQGRLDLVAAYCARDVSATFACVQMVRGSLGL